MKLILKQNTSLIEPQDHDDSEMMDENPIAVDDKNEDDEESPYNYEIPNCSSGEASLNWRNSFEEERRRWFSQSDCNVDIRNRTRQSLRALFDNFCCECESEVSIEGLKGQVGVVENLYIDPA